MENEFQHFLQESQNRGVEDDEGSDEEMYDTYERRDRMSYYKKMNIQADPSMEVLVTEDDEEEERYD